MRGCLHGRPKAGGRLRRPHPPIGYYPLNSRGKNGVQDEKKWYLKTMFQRSKIIVSENGRITREKCGHSCEEVWWRSRKFWRSCREDVVDDHESLLTIVEKVCRSLLMMMKVLTKLSRRCCWWSRKFVGVCRESAFMLKGNPARIGWEIKKVVCEDVSMAGLRPAGACGAHTNPHMISSSKL